MLMPRILATSPSVTAILMPTRLRSIGVTVVCTSAAYSPRDRYWRLSSCSERSSTERSKMRPSVSPCSRSTLRTVSASNSRIPERSIWATVGRSCASAGEKSVEVVVEGEGHHYQQQREPHALPDLDRALGNGPALYDLDRIIHQVPAVEQRDRQQVQHTQADADQREEREVRDPSRLRRLAGEIGDRDRSREGLPRHLSEQHLAQDPE